jgi:hypothetical protein
MVIHLHLGKTGGTTLAHILDWNYSHIHVITHYDQIPPLLALSDEEKRRCDCLRGQFFYGIHQYFPQPAVYITIMRHPMKRFISQYYYTMERRRRQNLPGQDLTMEQFLDSEPFQAYMQLCLLRNTGSIEEALHTPLAPDAVAEAKRNIETHFVVAGTLDYYDESLILMKRALGWSRAFYARRNTGTTASKPISDSMRRRVERTMEPELEVYEWVETRLKATLAEQDDSFRA